MKTYSNKIKTLAGLVAVSLLALSSANATLVPITYSVAGTSISVGGDTVTLGGSGSTQISLEPNYSGTPVLSLLNTVDWNVTKTGSTGVYDTQTLNRTMTVSIAVNPLQTLSQNVDLTIYKHGNTDNQTLTIASSSPLNFNWTAAGISYQLSVEALEYTDSYTDPKNELPQHKYGNIYGSFSLTSTSLTAVPEPSSIIAGVLLLIPLAGSTVRVIRRNKV